MLIEAPVWYMSALVVKSDPRPAVSAIPTVDADDTLTCLVLPVSTPTIL